MRTLITLLSTGFYTGFTPHAPGTAGSILGLLLVWGLASLTIQAYLLAIILILVVGVWVSGRAEEIFGHDGHEIVIDEVFGILIVFIGLELSIFNVISGFILFRALDIWKPFPCNFMQGLPSGFGVMMDDAIAAVYAHFILLILGFVL
tara:strand:- start:80195 stop:80638 length:444 start_codon:yes stop_codon:yes gene_type:complete